MAAVTPGLRGAGGAHSLLVLRTARHRVPAHASRATAATGRLRVFGLAGNGGQG